MKKTVCMLLAICIYLVGINASFADAVPAAPAQEVIADSEISRAASLNLMPAGMEASLSQTTTYSLLCTCIGNMLEKVDPNLLPIWKDTAAHAIASNKKMNRQEGMLALFYAAQIMGIDHSQTDWAKLNDKIGKPWDVFMWEYPLFPNWTDNAFYDFEWDNHMLAAYFFSMGMQSPVSGRRIFDYDPNLNSMRAGDPFTNDEAVRAVLRLFDSTQKPVERTQNDWDKQFLQSAQARKAEIMNSRVNITCAGKAYYVSNAGKDSNNGLSPQKPWATLKKVNGAKLKPGDAVFFERGGTWRGYLNGRNGVTYSAYGEGKKPNIYGSPENGAGAGKWKLVKGTSNIWEFYKEIEDCGLIVYNEGESWAHKTIAYWNGKEFVGSDLHTKYDILTLDDQMFFSDVRLKRYQPTVYMYELNVKGKLFLRCDQGNPGEIYTSIEFLNDGNDNICVARAGDGTVFDNLCFRYGGNCGVCLTRNAILQNSEVGWFGGLVLSYNRYDESENPPSMGDVVIRAGDGVQLGGVNNTAVNNYIHNIYDYGMTVETGFRDYFNDEIMENLVFMDNLLENCNGGAAIINWEQTVDENHRFRNITVDNNFFLYIGYGWSHKPHLDFNQLDMSTGMMFFDSPNVNDGIYIRNNVFYLSKCSLVNCRNPRKYWPVFSGNTYVQNAYSVLFECKYDDIIIKVSSSAPEAEKQAVLLLDEKNGVIIPPN